MKRLLPLLFCLLTTHAWAANAERATLPGDGA